jgi:hypothetical protein
LINPRGSRPGLFCPALSGPSSRKHPRIGDFETIAGRQTPAIITVILNLVPPTTDGIQANEKRMFPMIWPNGYVFGDAVMGRDGQFIFGENDNLGHL